MKVGVGPEMEVRVSDHPIKEASFTLQDIEEILQEAEPVVEVEEV